MEIEKVAKAIAYLRKRAGYTQKDLADRLGVSDKAVSKWERGLGLPDVSSLRKLSILLDTDTDSLLTGDVIHHDKGWHGILMLDKTESGVDLRAVIYDKPMVYFLLSYFLLVGIRRILVACSDIEQRFLCEEFGAGERLGISLIYGKEVQKALKENPDFEQCSNYMVVHGRTLIYGVDQTRFFQKAMLEKNQLTVLSLPRGGKTSRKRLNFDVDRKIINEDYDRMLTTQYDYYDIPVLFCPQNMIRSVCAALAEGFLSGNSALNGIPMYTEILDRGFVEITMDTWEEVQNASNFVQIVQKACNMHIYCIEEIAWRRGMISMNDLKTLGQEKSETEYGRYIISLINE